MQYRTLGASGLRISVIAFGCGNVGGLFTVASATDQQTEAVKRAGELGVNWFDTAPQYGQGNSEKNLGLALKRAGLRDYSVSTKVRLVYEDLRDIMGAVRRSVEASLERLGMDRVVLVQLHNSVTEVRGTRRDALGAFQDVLGGHGVLEGLERLRAERICQAIGFTGLGDTASLRLMARSGGFQAAQVYYNLLNPSADYSLPPATGMQNYGMLLDDLVEMKVGALAIRVLAAGSLADPPRASAPGGALSPGSDFDEDRRRAAALAPLSKRYEVPLAQAAVRFAAGDKRIASVIVDASDVGQLEEAIEAAEKGPLPREYMEEWAPLREKDFRQEG